MEIARSAPSPLKCAEKSGQKPRSSAIGRPEPDGKVRCLPQAGRRGQSGRRRCPSPAASLEAAWVPAPSGFPPRPAFWECGFPHPMTSLRNFRRRSFSSPLGRPEWEQFSEGTGPPFFPGIMESACVPRINIPQPVQRRAGHPPPFPSAPFINHAHNQHNAVRRNRRVPSVLRPEIALNRRNAIPHTRPASPLGFIQNHAHIQHNGARRESSYFPGPSPGNRPQPAQRLSAHPPPLLRCLQKHPASRHNAARRIRRASPRSYLHTYSSFLHIFTFLPLH